jgi:hypothetical protein
VDTFWEGAGASAGTIAVLVISWLLTRRRLAVKDKVDTDAVVVQTIAEAMTELRAELTRARAIATEAEAATYQAQAALRRLAAELDQFGRALASHRAWDEAHVKDDAPPPPPLPTVPQWWEVVGPPFRPASDEPI